MPDRDKLREALTTLLEQRLDVDGRFTELTRIDGCSSGHFSVLLSATDGHTGKRVALKFLLPMLIGGYRADSFDREADLLHLLAGQPDIIQMVAPRSSFVETLKTEHGIEVPMQFSYYAVELASTDVGTIIANSEWDSDQLLVGFRGMCRGVQRLHARSITHRDLKPPNFLVMAGGQLRLSDLGTARHLDGVTPALATYSGPPGDIRYSPPEMLAVLHEETPEISFLADFFALGAILFEMFSGTVLGSRLYDARFVTDLAQAMVHVKRGQRRRIYDDLVTTIADARQIPSIAAFGAPVPNSLRDPVDDLVRRLAAIDYRKRLRDFASIFNRVDTCLFILRHEEKYQRWLREKRRRREAAALVLTRRFL